MESRAMKEKNDSLKTSRRNSVHAETITSVDQFKEGHREFLTWVKYNVLEDEETFNSFSGLVVPPFETNELTESIFSNFQKIFNSDKAYESIEFEDPELESDAKRYLGEIKHNEFWETEGFEALRSAVDSFLVVDLPAPELDEEGNVIVTDDLPEPFYYLLDVDKLFTVSIKKHAGEFTCEYIAFHCGKEKVALLDDEFYRVYRHVDEAFELLYESPHFLDYCPAKPFWNTPLNSKTLLQKRSPLTNSLSEMDWLLFLQFANKYQQTYGSFPMYAMYTAKCDYRDNDMNARCNQGILYNNETNRPIKYNNGTSVQKCPKCGDKMKKGPGKTLQLKAPQQPGDPNLMDSPLKIISPDVKSLEYLTNELERLKQSIYSNVVGKGTDMINGQAVNESQIDGIFESKKNVLLGIKNNFEIIKKFATDTVLKLRYQDNFIDSTINLGDPIFTENYHDKMKEYSNAKESGMPNYHLSEIRNSIYYSKFKDDPEKIGRYKILKELEPYQNNTLEELIELNQKNPAIFKQEDLILKADFQRYIDRFEREFGNIAIFGKRLELNERVNKVKKQLYNYVTEQIERPAIDGASGSD